MARKLLWTDLPDVMQIQNRKQFLDNSLRLIYNPGLLSSSFLSLVSPPSGFVTVIDTGPSNSQLLCLGQLFHVRGNHTARLASLAPEQLNDSQACLRVLGDLEAAAANLGALQVTAEVPGDSPLVDLLTRLGYRTFAEQRIWKLPRRMSLPAGSKAWLPVSHRDLSEVTAIYQRAVPGRIKRVEPPPTTENLSGMACWQAGKMVGFGKVEFGPRGILADVITEPGLESVDEYLGALVFHLPYRNTRDIYLRVRAYQGQLNSALEKTSAREGECQKAMVKRLAVHYNAKQAFVVPGFEKQPDITTPISNTKLKT